MVWDVIERCSAQLRAGAGRPYALDFAAVQAFGRAYGADEALLVEVLPSVSSMIVIGIGAALDEAAD